jgi:hypothetical protein
MEMINSQIVQNRCERLKKLLTKLVPALASVFAIVSILPVLALTIYSIAEFYYLVTSPSSWSAVQGVIDFSNMDETANKGIYQRVWFDYVVNDKQLTSYQRFQLGPDENLKYAEGNKIQVYYKSSNPHKAVVKLENSLTEEIIEMVLNAVLVVLPWIGIIALIGWSIRRLRKI